MTKSVVDTTSGGGLVPTVTDNAFSLGLIDAHEVGISFEPSNQISATNGELTFGGIDPSKFTGDLHFVYVFSLTPPVDAHTHRSKY